jgi:small subunit ribosomal protein S9
MTTSSSWESLKALKEKIDNLDSNSKESKFDSKGRIYATGKRKTSVARVWLKKGNGTVMVNKLPLQVYFKREALRVSALYPFNHTSRHNQYDVHCTVDGGGFSGQSGAIRHGISKALQIYEPDLRSSLKVGGFLTRDARKVERKKPGFRKARKLSQFSKR